MADSLRDQLVKAGLATASQAKKAERQNRAEQNARRQGQSGDELPVSGPGKNKGKARKRPPSDPNSPANVKARAAKLQAEKQERDRAIAQIANEKSAAKALRAEIKQIILANDQRTKTKNEDDVPYNFVHGKKIKRIYVPRKQQEQLSSGSLVIVNNDGLYHLVPKAVAERIATRDPKRIIAAHEDRKPEPGSDDEFYAKFEVPDDLDW